MEKGLTVFNHEEFGDVRTLVINGDVWFVAVDVAKCLGYENLNDAVGRHCDGVAFHEVIDSKGRKQTARIIREPDVYALIFGSKLERAKEFKRWVFEEVLPSLRKTGNYSMFHLDEEDKEFKRFKLFIRKLMRQAKLFNLSKEERIPFFHKECLLRGYPVPDFLDVNEGNKGDEPGVVYVSKESSLLTKFCTYLANDLRSTRKNKPYITRKNNINIFDFDLLISEFSYLYDLDSDINPVLCAYIKADSVLCVSISKVVTIKGKSVRCTVLSKRRVIKYSREGEVDYAK